MEKVWRQIRNAVSGKKEISVSITTDRIEATVKTIKGGYPWRSDMLVQIRAKQKGYCWCQTFDVVEDAMEALNGRT